MAKITISDGKSVTEVEFVKAAMRCESSPHDMAAGAILSISGITTCQLSIDAAIGETYGQSELKIEDGPMVTYIKFSRISVTIKGSNFHISGIATDINPKPEFVIKDQAPNKTVKILDTQAVVEPLPTGE